MVMSANANTVLLETIFPPTRTASLPFVIKNIVLDSDKGFEYDKTLVKKITVKNKNYTIIVELV